MSRRVCLTLNLGAILVPLFYIACLLPFAIHSCRRYDEFIGDFDVLLLALNDLDRNFSGSASILDVADKIPLVTALNDASNALLGSLRQTFIVLAASGVFLFFVSFSSTERSAALRKLTHRSFRPSCRSPPFTYDR